MRSLASFLFCCCAGVIADRYWCSPMVAVSSWWVTGKFHQEGLCQGDRKIDDVDSLEEQNRPGLVRVKCRIQCICKGMYKNDIYWHRRYACPNLRMYIFYILIYISVCIIMHTYTHRIHVWYIYHCLPFDLPQKSTMHVGQDTMHGSSGMQLCSWTLQGVPNWW